MNRRSTATDSSLELLLDTICNTFGGVLFIAILVTVLLRMTSPIVSESDPETDTNESLRLSARREQLLAEVESLQSARKHQESLQVRFTEPDSARLFAELKTHRQQRDDLAAEQQRLRQGISQSESAASKARDKSKNTKGEIERLAKVALQTEELLNREVERRTQSTRLPKLETSFKREVAIVVRYGRLYFDRHYGAEGTRLGPNYDEFMVLPGGGEYLRLTPKPYAGIPLTDSNSGEQIARSLRRFNPDQVHLAICVWDDSFDSFQQLKASILDRKFQYRLLPIPTGKSVYEGSTAPSEVQ